MAGPRLRFTPPPTGEPISTVIIAVAFAIGKLFGLFGGGVNRETKRALNELRNSILGIANAQTIFTRWVVRAFSFFFNFVRDIWGSIIRPLLERIRDLYERLRRWMDKILARHQEIMRIVRERILRIYDRFFRPILQVISVLRAMLAVLRLARLRWAERLDARLARLEGKIIAPILELLRRANQHARFLNVLLRLDGILQRGTFMAAQVAYIGRVIRAWWFWQTPPVETHRAELLRLANRPLTPAEAAKAAREAVDSATGPYADALARGRARFREIVPAA